MGKIRVERRKKGRRPPLGTLPGTITTDPGAPPSELRLLAYGPDGFEEARVSRPQEAAPYLSRFPVTWLNVDGLGSAETIQAVGEVFGLHPLALEDVVSQHQRAKTESYGDYDFVVARMIEGTAPVETDQLSLFLGKNWVVTFQERPGDCFDPIRERIRKAHGRIRRSGPDYLTYSLLDGVIDAYYPVLESMGEMLDALEDETIRAPERRTVGKIHAVKRDLLSLRRAIWPLREAVNSLQRDETNLMAPETRIYLRDGYDHVVQLIDLLETYRELGSELTDLYLSSLSNRMNEVMKVLTVISTIFIPLTFIAGVYGMNFDPARSPWNMPEIEWTYGYPFVMGLMAVVAISLIVFFKRKGWIWAGTPAPPERPEKDGDDGPSPAMSGRVESRAVALPGPAPGSPPPAVIR